MKTILLISRCPPFPLHLGDRLILWHLARELSRRGYIIDLLALYDRDDDPQWQDEYAPFFRHIELIPEPPRPPLALLRRALLPSARFAAAANESFCPTLWQAIADYLKRHSYDLVHCFGAVSVYEFQPLFSQLPAVITPYESHSLYLRSAAGRGDRRARLQLPLARRYESFMFTPYDRTVVISEADRETLRSLQPALNIEVIPNGIELARFRPNLGERDEATLLFVGNYDYPPNQDAAKVLAREILPRVRQRMPQAKLQLVGFNPPAWLRGLADDKIEVTGAVPDVRRYLARATVFVCPLRFGAGMKNKLLEALAMGIPVVATPLSLDGINARDGESAIIAPDEEIAEATVRTLLDGGLRRRLAVNGRRLIEAEYSWARTAAGYERLYDEICLKTFPARRNL